MVMGEVDIGLIPATLPTITQVNVVDCFTYWLLHFIFKKVFMVMKEVIVVVAMKDMDLGFKRPATLTLKIMDKLFMVTVEVEIGIRTAPIPPIIHVGLVYIFGVYVNGQKRSGNRSQTRDLPSYNYGGL